jgi:hypothetical protein
MGGAAASPLAEIERAVQERAKDISLEMAAPGGEVKLRALIADEVARWNDDRTVAHQHEPESVATGLCRQRVSTVRRWVELIGRRPGDDQHRVSATHQRDGRRTRMRPATVDDHVDVLEPLKPTGQRP